MSNYAVYSDRTEDIRIKYSLCIARKNMTDEGERVRGDKSEISHLFFSPTFQHLIKAFTLFFRSNPILTRNVLLLYNDFILLFRLLKRCSRHLDADDAIERALGPRTREIRSRKKKANEMFMTCEEHKNNSSSCAHTKYKETAMRTIMDGCKVRLTPTAKPIKTSLLTRQISCALGRSCGGISLR